MKRYTMLNKNSHLFEHTENGMEQVPKSFIQDNLYGCTFFIERYEWDQYKDKEIK